MNDSETRTISAVPNQSKKKTLLIISQVYVPDPASVGQHMADAAAEMARRGYRVVVLTANRGYEDPSVKYPSREVLDGVEVRRLPWSSFGKQSIAMRLLGGVLFMLQAIVRGVFTKGLAGMLISTSPPLCPVAAIVIRAVRRVPIAYWVMDLNPDQMIALGKISEKAMSARLFNLLNRMILKRSARVIALDRFMADRLIQKHPQVRNKLTVLPPWPHEDHLETLNHEDNPFRGEHGWTDKFVIMFSGNLSIASPVDTVLEAALKLQDLPNVVFAFIGGGLGKKKVDQVIQEHAPPNIVSLPYQPLSRLRYSLSAADVHLVSMGDAIVGICHPCKVYGAMAVARPILLLGPDPCHVSDILSDHEIGWHIRHGDVEGAIQTIRQMVTTPRASLQSMGEQAKETVADQLSKEKLCGAFCDAVEQSMAR